CCRAFGARACPSSHRSRLLQHSWCRNHSRTGNPIPRQPRRGTASDGTSHHRTRGAQGRAQGAEGVVDADFDHVHRHPQRRGGLVDRALPEDRLGEDLAVRGRQGLEGPGDHRGAHPLPRQPGGERTGVLAHSQSFTSSERPAPRGGGGLDCHATNLAPHPPPGPPAYARVKEGLSDSYPAPVRLMPGEQPPRGGAHPGDRELGAADVEGQDGHGIAGATRYRTPLPVRRAAGAAAGMKAAWPRLSVKVRSVVRWASPSRHRSVWGRPLGRSSGSSARSCRTRENSSASGQYRNPAAGSTRQGTDGTKFTTRISSGTSTCFPVSPQRRTLSELAMTSIARPPR